MPYLSQDEVLYLKAVRHGIEKIVKQNPINNIELTAQQKKELNLTNSENDNSAALIESQITADQLSKLRFDNDVILYKRCVDIRRKYQEDVSISQRIANSWKALFGHDNNEYADFMSNIRTILKNDQFNNSLTAELATLGLENKALKFPDHDVGSQFGCGKQIQYVFKSYESGWLREDGKLAKIFSKIPNFKNFSDGVIQQFQPGIKRNLWILFILFVLLLTCIIPGLNFIGIPVTLIAIIGLSPMIMTIVTQAALSLVGLIFWHSDKLFHPKSDYLDKSVTFKRIEENNNNLQLSKTPFSISQTHLERRTGETIDNTPDNTPRSSVHRSGHFR